MLDKTLVLMRITNLFHTLVYIVKTSLLSSVEGSIIGHVVQVVVVHSLSASKSDRQHLVAYYKGTQRQISENICSEDDLRSRIFGTFCCKISCFPASYSIFEHRKKWYNEPFLTDFYPKKVTLNFREPPFWLKFSKR